MNKYNKWLKTTSLTIVFLLITFATFIIVIDPYFHYHKPLKAFGYTINNERYQNDGITKHFDYNAIITGTSMTQNFKTSEFDNLFKVNSIKVPFSGAGFKEISNNLLQGLKNNISIKLILWGLDYNGLNRAHDWKRYDSYPTYLYDANLFNDVEYIYSKNIFMNSIDTVLNSLNGAQTTTFDVYSTWSYPNGKEAVLSTYTRPDMSEVTSEGINVEVIKKNISSNIINVVEQYPNVKFVFFFTPYSILYWDSLVRTGSHLNQIETEKLVIEMLLEYDNVELHCFFEDMEVITNLDNYKDSGHYTAEINSWMLNAIKEKEYQITRDNYIDHIEKCKHNISTYDYDKIFE